jgi:hypothetical protein
MLRLELTRSAVDRLEKKVGTGRRAFGHAETAEGGYPHIVLAHNQKNVKTEDAAGAASSGKNLCHSYGFVVTVFIVASSDGVPWPATKKLWSYMLRYMRPAISAALGPKVGRPPCRKTTTTTRPTLVLA